LKERIFTRIKCEIYI